MANHKRKLLVKGRVKSSNNGHVSSSSILHQPVRISEVLAPDTNADLQKSGLSSCPLCGTSFNECSPIRDECGHIKCKKCFAENFLHNGGHCPQCQAEHFVRNTEDFPTMTTNGTEGNEDSVSSAQLSRNSPLTPAVSPRVKVIKLTLNEAFKRREELLKKSTNSPLKDANKKTSAAEKPTPQVPLSPSPEAPSSQSLSPENKSTPDSISSSDATSQLKGAEAKNQRRKRRPILMPPHITISPDIGPDSKSIFHCLVCGKKFKTKAHYKYHEFCGSNEKPFKCEECGQGFIAKSHYEYHLRTHTGERPYKCPECGKGFNQQSKVTRHMRSHTGDRPFNCPQCGRGFATRQALAAHFLIHTGEKPYACEHCGKRFTGRTNLKKHLVVHTGEKPFQCHVCLKSFGVKWSLYLHLKTHSAERPYACQQCPRAFSGAKDLRRHLLIHTGERPFKCRICSTAFRRKDNLERHIRTTHSLDKELAKAVCMSADEANATSQQLLISQAEAKSRSQTGAQANTAVECGPLILQSQVESGGLSVVKNSPLCRPSILRHSAVVPSKSVLNLTFTNAETGTEASDPLGAQKNSETGMSETSYENMDGTNEHYMEDGETSDGDFAITHCLAIKEEKVAALECFSPRQHTSIIGEFSLPQELSEHPAKVEATEDQLQDDAIDGNHAVETMSWELKQFLPGDSMRTPSDGVDCAPIKMEILDNMFANFPSD